MNRFYLVWSPSGKYPPKYRHETPAQAQTEAERLAKEHPGSEFFVIAAMARSYVPPFQITEQLAVPVTEEDIPF